MTNEEKELMGILYNLIQIPTIGTELRTYAEDKMISLLKGSECKCKVSEPALTAE